MSDTERLSALVAGIRSRHTPSTYGIPEVMCRGCNHVWPCPDITAVHTNTNEGES